MDVFDFCNLCTDDTAEVRIFDLNPDVENEVFKGSMWDAEQSAFSDWEVLSFDLCVGNIHDGFAPFIILNIDTSES